MIVVTGAAGFIGSNLVKALNDRGEDDIIAVDNLTRGDKFRNLVDCRIADYLDKEEFLRKLGVGAYDGELTAVLHQGACSDTMESNGRYMMENNYRYSAELLDFCQAEEVPFIYASSASVYGAGTVFREDPAHERPLNVYGYSKFLFDNLVRRRWSDNTTQVVGLRYFNVYGPREAHKGRMASVAFHFFNQYRAEGRVKLFEGSGGFDAGEQRRDFVSVRGRGRGEPVFPRSSRSTRASSTSAPAARRPSTKSRLPRSTRCASPRVRSGWSWSRCERKG